MDKLDTNTADNNAEQPVRVSIKESSSNFSDYQEPTKSIPIAGVTVSRRPAAIVGIVITLCIGYGFVEGVNFLRGDVTETAEILLTANGASPAQISVSPNQEIIWSNRTNKPQIVHSDTLCNADKSECLHTGPIGVGQVYQYIVSEELAGGSYSYTSTTDDNLTGTIVVGENTEVKDGFESLSILDVLTETIEQGSEIPETTEEPAQPEVQAQVVSIPQNPNTGIDATNPIREAESAALRSGAPEGKGKGKPFTQPETGPAMWAIGIVSLLCMYIAMRRMVKNETHAQ